MVDFVSQILINPEDENLDCDQPSDFTEHMARFASSSVRSSQTTGILVRPPQKSGDRFSNLVANIVDETASIIFYAPSRRVMVRLLNEWANGMKGQSGKKTYIASKYQLGVTWGDYGSMLPVTPLPLRIVGGKVQTAFLNIKPLLKRTKASIENLDIRDDKHRFRRVVDNEGGQYREYSVNNAKADWFLNSVDKGGFFCYVGNRNPQSIVALHSNGKKAFTLQDIASFIQRG